MFDETLDPNAVENSMPKPLTEDIFAGTDSAATGQATQPAAFQPMEPSLVNTTLNELPVKDNKKYLVLSGLIILIILIGAGGWFGYKTLSGSSSSNNNSTSTDTNNPLQPDNPTQVAPDNLVVTPLDIPTTADSLPTDSSATTTESATSTTTANSSTTTAAVSLTDSDSDALADTDEAKWGTNPLKTDTDGDGFSDSAEITSGYNPLDTGKLTAEQLELKLQTQLQ